MDSAAVSQPGRNEVDARVAQLTRDLADAIDEQTATSEVLAAIGRSGSELEPVFEHVGWFSDKNPGSVCRAEVEVAAPLSPPS